MDIQCVIHLAALAIAGYSIYRFYCDFTASHIRKGSFDDDDFKNK